MHNAGITGSLYEFLLGTGLCLEEVLQLAADRSEVTWEREPDTVREERPTLPSPCADTVPCLDRTH